MTRLEINPKYRALLESAGLRSPGDFLALDGVILWGHPDRSVERLAIGSGSQAVTAYLKKEHRIRWRERGRNAWAGFGFVSKSMREYVILSQMQDAGIGCPEVIAGGEVDGRAFVMVAEVAGGQDLRQYLQKPMAYETRRILFTELGRAIARMHDAGFVHPDLYAKHVLVVGEQHPWRFVFIDWQRGWRELPADSAWRTLAKLEATLPDELATPRERLACLRAYWQTRGVSKRLCDCARRLSAASRTLQLRRQVQETRQPPLPAGTQHLIQVGDTTLYVTRHLPESWAANIATWLNSAVAAESRQSVSVRSSHEGELVRRRTRRFWDWFNRTVRRRPLTSPDFENAAKLFRLERFGVRTPRLLAVGHRSVSAGETVSFLLTEHPAGAIPLREWQARPHEASRRRKVIREAAEVFRRIHKAGYFFDAREDTLADQFLIDADAVLWRGVEHLRRRFPLSPQRIRKDLASLSRSLGNAFSRSDQLRFLYGYLNLNKLTFMTKNLIRSLLAPKGRVVACR